MKRNKFKHITTSLIVGYDQSSEDDAIMMIGHQGKDGVMKVINAFKGEEAKDLYATLIKTSHPMFDKNAERLDEEVEDDNDVPT